MSKHRKGRHSADSNVIDATHLFSGEPAPEVDSEFWTWGKEWVDDGILHLDFLMDEVRNATSEDDLRRALTDMRDEIKTYPID